MFKVRACALSQAKAAHAERLHSPVPSHSEQGALTKQLTSNKFLVNENPGHGAAACQVLQVVLDLICVVAVVDLCSRRMLLLQEEGLTCTAAVAVPATM